MLPDIKILKFPPCTAGMQIQLEMFVEFLSFGVVFVVAFRIITQAGFVFDHSFGMCPERLLIFARDYNFIQFYVHSQQIIHHDDDAAASASNYAAKALRLQHGDSRNPHGFVRLFCRQPQHLVNSSSEQIFCNPTTTSAALLRSVDAKRCGWSP